MVARLTDKNYEEFKKLSDKHGHKYESELEMKQSADNLVRLVEVLIEIDQKEQARKQRLVTELKGFSMPGKGRNCSLCGCGVYEGDGWYDKWGFKCMNCQDAVNKKKIPGSLCGDYDHKKCITDSTLSMKSGLHVQTIRKLIRHGKIKARQIPHGPYMILRKENPSILDVLDAEIKARAE
jgi:hypothetical protein